MRTGMQKLRIYPKAFGKKLCALWQNLVTDKAGMPALPPSVPKAAETFASLTFEDLWAEASMASVCHWLRGGRDLQIPESFRSLLPKRL